MPVEVKLPRLGQGMEAGTIVKWLVSEGDTVEKGDPLYELDTEKVTQEVEAEASGVLLKIAVSEGEVEVGRTIAFIGEAGEQVEGAAGGGDGAAPAAVEPAAAEGGEPGPVGAERPAEGPAREPERERGREAAAAEAGEQPPAAGAEPGAERVKASPLARRIARERGVSLDALRGTGPDGRIVAEDVERAAAGVQEGEAAPAPAPAGEAPAAPAAPGEVEVVQLSSIRRTIARRLTQAWEVPAFQLTVSADMTNATALVRRARELAAEGAAKVTVTDLLVKVCASALMRHREVNAHHVEDSIRIFPTANVGVAVAIANGLVVPVVAAAERLRLAEVAEARAALVGRAKAGKLSQEDLGGGTFTISNLGMFGIEQFVAVLNPPQAAILAVGATEERPVVREGELQVLPMCTLTLTCDHRTIDGATGAEFLQTVKAFLEDPGLAL